VKTTMAELLKSKGKTPRVFIENRGDKDTACNGVPTPVKEEKTERIAVCQNCGCPLGGDGDVPAKLHFQDKLDDDPYGVLNELGGQG
jgi:hypothetical protein